MNPTAPDQSFLNNRLRDKLWTLGSVLGGLAICSSVIAFGDSWLTIIVIGLFSVYICSEILVGYLPYSLASAMKRNCIRQDGSWSRKREKAERLAVAKIRWDLRVILLLLLIPSISLAYLVDREIVPLRIGFNGLASLRSTETETRANLTEEENNFDDWATGNLMDRWMGVDVATQKRVLWNLWPVALIGALCWLTGCWIGIRQSYLYQLKELADGIKRRGEEYIQFDRANGF